MKLLMWDDSNGFQGWQESPGSSGSCCVRWHLTCELLAIDGEDTPKLPSSQGQRYRFCSG